MMEFVGMKKDAIVKVLDEQGHAYHIFEDGSISYIEKEPDPHADWMLQVFGRQPKKAEWHEYADGQIILEFEDGICVEEYEMELMEDWD